MLLTRRLLLALLLAGLGLTGGTAVGAAGAASAPAVECLADDASLQERTIGADDVFSGTVTDRRARGNRVTYAVAVGRVYKGDVNTAEVSVSARRADRRCGLPRLDRDASYVFFTAGPDLTTSEAAGTAPATDARVAKVEGLLGGGQTPVPPEPAEATFTLVDSERTSFERVAAPGLALVIVGLLGLVLAVGLSRRRS